MKKLIIILIVLSFVGVCLAASIQDMHKAVIARRNVAAPAGCGTIEEVQLKYAQAVATEVTVVLDSTPIEGNLLTASLYGGSAEEDMSVAGFAKVISSEYSTTPKDVVLYWKVAGAAESTSVVGTATDAINSYMIVQEWAGVNAVDQSVANPNVGGVTEMLSGEITTTVNDELLIAVWGLGASSGEGESFTNSFSQVAMAGNTVFYAATRIVAATGTYSSTFSWTTDRIAGGLIASFYCE